MIHARVSRGPDSEIAEIHISITAESIPGFTALISDALNCRPDVHPELKELGDMLTHGRVLQDYYHTRTDKSNRP